MSDEQTEQDGSGGGTTRSPFLEAVRRRWPWLVAIVAMLVLIPAMRPLLRHEPDPPPVLGEVRAFELTDQQGEPFDAEELDGQPWVASFIFTTCTSTCPRVSSAMAELQQRLVREEVDARLVSFTVDPENDTPDVLADYAEEYDARRERWRFLTGSEKTLHRIIVDDFHVNMGEASENDEGERSIPHSTRLALVDAQGRVRGFYEASPDGVDEVFHRLRQLLHGGAQPPS